MSIELDQINQAFQSKMYKAQWRSPRSDDEFQTESHYIIVEDDRVFKACRSVTSSEAFDLQSPVDFKLYPPCKTCSQQALNLGISETKDS